MASLARSNINHEWRLFLSAVIVLFLSGCLYYVAVGLTQATMRGLTAYKRSLDVDLYVRNSDFKNKKELIHFLNVSQSFTFIQLAEPLPAGFLTSNTVVSGRLEKMKIIGLEVDAFSVIRPSFFSEEATKVLQETGTAIISGTLETKNGYGLGGLIWNEDQTVALKIVGYFHDDINNSSLMSGEGFAFVSKGTKRLFFEDSFTLSSRSWPSVFNLIAIKLKPNIPLNVAREKLKSVLKDTDLEVLSSEELMNLESAVQISESGVLKGFLAFCFFATLVPFFIIVQTLKSAILSQVSEFAILKALGVSTWKLSMIAIEQSFWIGFIGATLSYCGMIGLRKLFERADIDFYISSTSVLVISIFIIAGSIIAGSMSLGTISKARPLDLLR